MFSQKARCRYRLHKCGDGGGDDYVFGVVIGEQSAQAESFAGEFGAGVEVGLVDLSGGEKVSRSGGESFEVVLGIVGVRYVCGDEQYWSLEVFGQHDG